MKIHSRLLFAGIALLILLGIALPLWRARVVAAQENNRFRIARTRLEQGRVWEALEVVQAQEQISPISRPDSRWLPVKIEVATRAGSAPILQDLYRRFPEQVLAQEKAALLLARAALLSPPDKDSQASQAAYRKIRDTWKQTAHPEWWMAVEVDALLSRGKVAEAEKRLRAQTFPGAADIGRLTRLAMIRLKSDPLAAWNLLEQAYRLDSRNADVRTFRGQILEASGKPAAARVEYAAAWLADPRDAVHCDNLAEFYRRQGMLEDAARTWRDGLNSGADTAFLQVKAQFWSRVAYPALFSADARPLNPPTGPDRAFADYLQHLDGPRFWDDAAFDPLLEARRIEQTRPEAYWLRLLGVLQSGNERQAMHLLEASPFAAQSFDPVLERSLYRVLQYRQKITPPRPLSGRVRPKDRAGLHSFFARLEAEPQKSLDFLPEKERRFLRGDAAYAALFLAAGWLEAAVRLKPEALDLRDAPEWYLYGMVQALRTNRSAADALTFLRPVVEQPKPLPTLALLYAELLIAEGNEAEGMQALIPLAQNPTEIGYRAAWLLTIGYSEQGKFDAAKQAITGQPLLARSDGGKALLARLSLAQNDVAGAERLFREIAPRSGEAQSYLAQKAFREGNYGEARRWTLRLLETMPDALELRENLAEIAAAEKAAGQVGKRGKP
ncbi:MAG: hypothetical protein OHK0029_12280 [Armatimonadaceae bacterium]